MTLPQVLYTMSDFDDFQKHEIPVNGGKKATKNDEAAGTKLIKWVSSVLGSLIVLFTWDLYCTNRDMLQKVNDSLSVLTTRQAELTVEIQNLKEKVDRLQQTQ